MNLLGILRCACVESDILFFYIELVDPVKKDEEEEKFTNLAVVVELLNKIISI